MVSFRNLKRNASEIMQKVRRDGIRAAGSAAVKRARANPRRWILLADEAPKYQTASRVDFEQRWEILSSHLPPNARNAADIGCYEGAITKRSAKEGLFTLGIEREADRVSLARRQVRNQRNCHILEWDIDPGDVDQLPSFDVIFLLTVYYHWVNQYGFKEAEDMLRTLKDKAGTLFLETPEDSSKIDSPHLSQEQDLQPHELLRRYFARILDGSTVEYIGNTDYKGGKRKDAIYLIR